MFSNEAPLVFRPQADWRQWRRGLQFLAQCNDAAFERNVRQLVALGSYAPNGTPLALAAVAQKEFLFGLGQLT